MKYPHAFIEQVKGHLRLSDVIGARIALKKHGREHQACCPFHHEKTPSFTVNDTKGFYHCFGCGAHGDALTFVMEYEKRTYPEAIESLAQEAGIPLPPPDARMAQKYAKESDAHALMQAASRWFTQQLYASVGHTARTYLHKRGITPEMTALFGIGYAPQHREGLKYALAQQGFTEHAMMDLGLLIKIDDKPSYDRFRGRVMFPIHRTDGVLVGFGGRLLEASDHAPKYLNSPETWLFKKQELLFHMHQVRKIAHDAPAIVVVEGYTDALSLYAHGIPYAVAPLGTAFGEQHLQLLWKHHPNPILCFDGDKAGQKAMLRAVEIILPHLTPTRLMRFCGLPSGEDPDSFIRTNGKAAFEALMQRALNISDVLWNMHIASKNISSPEALATAEELLMQDIARINDAGLKKRLSNALSNRLWHVSKQMQRSASYAVMGKPALHASLSLAVPTTQRSEQHPLAKLLNQAMCVMMLYPSLLHESEVEQMLTTWDWSVSSYHRWVAHLLSHPQWWNEDRGALCRHMQSHDHASAQALRGHYAQKIVPSWLLDGEHREEALSMLHKIRDKVAYYTHEHEIRTTVQHEHEVEHLYEMIKMQQKEKNQHPSHHDDSLI